MGNSVSNSVSNYINTDIYDKIRNGHRALNLLGQLVSSIVESATQSLQMFTGKERLVKQETSDVV